MDGLLYDDPAGPRGRLRHAVPRPGPRPGRRDQAQAGARAARQGGRLRGAAPEHGAAASLRRSSASSRWRPDGSELLPLPHARADHPRQPPRLEEPALAGQRRLRGQRRASWRYERRRAGPHPGQGRRRHGRAALPGDGGAGRRGRSPRLTDFAFDRTAWDLLLAYLPYPDEALHTWLGVLDPGVPGHDPALAARLRPFLDESLRMVDGFVGPPGRPGRRRTWCWPWRTDHGMQGVSRGVRPNVALAAAGLLALDAAGRGGPRAHPGRLLPRQHG